MYSRPVPKPYDNLQSKFTVVVSGLTRQCSTSSNILFFKQLCIYFPKLKCLNVKLTQTGRAYIIIVSTDDQNWIIND